MSNLAKRLIEVENNIVVEYIHYYENGYGYSFSNIVFQDGSTFSIVSDYGDIDLVPVDKDKRHIEDFHIIKSKLPVEGKVVRFAYSIVSSNRGEWGLVFIKFTDNTSVIFQLWGDPIENHENETLYLDIDHNEILFIDLVLGVMESEEINNNKFILTLTDESIVEVEISNGETLIKIVKMGEIYQQIEMDITPENFNHWISEEIDYLIKHP